MNSNLITFDFNNNKIRVININDNPYFVANEVTNILGYSNGRDAISKHVDKEDITTILLPSQNATSTDNRNKQHTLVNESGLYALILSSKISTAKLFKKWVTSEVLPSIRKTGSYFSPETVKKSLLNPDFIIQMATELKEEQYKRKQAEAELLEAKPKLVFANAVEGGKGSILIGELAKILKQNGIDIGQNRLFDWLRNHEYIHKNKNIPTQKAMDLGLFSIKETAIAKPNGETKLILTTKVTGKGQQYFINKFLCKEIAV